MNTIFIDIETNGLPQTIKFNEYYDPSDYDNIKYYNSSRIIEIAYIIYDVNNKKVKSFSSLVRSKYIKIENTEIHGITKKECNDKGMKLSEIFSHLIDDLDDCNTIVAHNIKFDFNIILSEIYRDIYNTNDTINEQCMLQFAGKLNKMVQVCTMAMGKNYMQSTKFPKLTDLHEYLFNEKFTQKHRALSDTEYCAKCYYKML